jgi:hypothetical protein
VKNPSGHRGQTRSRSVGYAPYDGSASTTR